MLLRFAGKIKLFRGAFTQIEEDYQRMWFLYQTTIF